MAHGKSIELGGEILTVGSTVIVYGGGRRGVGKEELPITKIGTKYIHIKRHGSDAPFDVETRRDAKNTNGYVGHFKTHTEVARIEKRRDLIRRLHDLGLQPTQGSSAALDQYDDATLEEVIAILSQKVNSEK